MPIFPAANGQGGVNPEMQASRSGRKADGRDCGQSPCAYPGLMEVQMGCAVLRRKIQASGSFAELMSSCYNTV